MKKNQFKAMTVEEFAETLAQRQALEIELDGIRNEMEAEMAKVRDQFGMDIASLTIQVETLSKLQLEWMRDHKAEFNGPPRSMDFPTATVGYRLGQPHLKPRSKWTWDKVLETLQKVNPAFIRNVPEVDRESLIAQRDDFGADGLAVFGLKVAQDDKAFIEIKREPAQ